MNELPDPYSEPLVNPEDFIKPTHGHYDPERILPKSLQDMIDRRNFGVTWEEYLAEHEDE